MSTHRYPIADFRLELEDLSAIRIVPGGDKTSGVREMRLPSGGQIGVRVVEEAGKRCFELCDDADMAGPARHERYAIERFDTLRFRGEELLAWKAGGRGKEEHHTYSLGAGWTILAIRSVKGEYFLDVRSALPPIKEAVPEESRPPLPASRKGPGQKVRMIPDTGGFRMETLIMVPPNLFYRGEGGIKPGYHAAFQALSGDGILLLGVLKADEQRLRALLDHLNVPEDAVEIFPLDGDRLRMWVRDPMLVQITEDGFFLGGSCFVDGHSPLNVHLSGILDRRSYFRRSMASHLDGGNLITGREMAFVGKNYVAEFAAASGISLDEATEHLRRDLGMQRLYVVGTEAPLPPELLAEADFPVDWASNAGNYQPSFHLDVFMSYLGPDPDGQHRILLGDPSVAWEMGQAAFLEPSPALLSAFREVEEALRRDGFRVTRLPLPLCEGSRGYPNFYASGLNVLLAMDSQRARVWLPQYGDPSRPEAFAEVDREVLRRWRETLGPGTLISPIPLMLPFVHEQGALRCITNILNRAR